MTRAKVNKENCLKAIEEFWDCGDSRKVPARADAGIAAQLMIRYLTEHQYMDEYCRYELNDMAYACLVESATA